MKKLHILFILLFASSTINSQYLSKDFDDLSLTSGGWTTQIVIDTTNWFVDDFGGDKFVKATNYSNGQNIPADTWLISPVVDLSSSTQPMLSFETIMKWPGAALTLYISTDYDGNSNPTQQGTWTDITSLATWDVDNSTWGDWTPSGFVDLSAYISSTTYVAYNYIGSSTSGSTWEIDNILINEGSGPPAPGTGDSVSIYEIQYTNNSNGISPYDGLQIYTGGIVSGVRNDSSFYLSSGEGPWSGIYVFSNDNLLNIGDSITLNAEVVEFYDLTELKNVTSLTVVNSSNNLYINNCSTSAVNMEDFESCLVKVSNAICNNDNAGFGEWVINDGTGDISVDDLMFSFNPILNNSYNVTGLSTFSFGNFKLLPRDGADVEQFLSSVESDFEKIKIYPNPVKNGKVWFELSKDRFLSLYDYNGKLIYSKYFKKGNRELDVNNLQSGIYFVKIDKKTYKLSIQ